MSWHADNLDGTYTNPILWGDYPDPDVIRVGDIYYFISTSMEYMPGCPILKSRDLVNWEAAGYAVSRIDAHPNYDLHQNSVRGAGPWPTGGLDAQLAGIAGNVYGSGPWAASLRYNDGRFYVLFACNDLNTSFLCTAEEPAGPWDMTDLGVKLYDPSMLFDDDGRVYAVYGQTTISLYELNPDCRSVKAGPLRLYSGAYGTEGSRIYRTNGYYYILNVGHAPEICHRSRRITGPYEEKAIYSDAVKYSQPHQGCLVDTPSGEWWSMLFQDRAGVGRVPMLFPVTWVDGWPMFGPNGDGKGVITYRKPGVGKPYPASAPATTDFFDSPVLGLQWQWNHNPDDAGWSLAERPGYLRLRTVNTVRDIFDIYSARNTLLQRVEGPGCAAAVEMDASGMREGDVAGLGVFQKPYAFIAVHKERRGKRIIMVNSDEIVEETGRIDADTVWFRAESLPYADRARFSYSLDNRLWRPFGNELAMSYDLSVFEGNRFSLISYTTGKTGGYADFRWFKLYNETLYANRFNALRPIRAQRHDEMIGADLLRMPDSEGLMDLYVGRTAPGAWLRFNNVNFLWGAEQSVLRAALERGGGDGRIELRLDAPDGPLLGVCAIPGAGAAMGWGIHACPVVKTSGRHALYIGFPDGGVALDWFRFIPAERCAAAVKAYARDSYVGIDSSRGHRLVIPDPPGGAHAGFDVIDAGDGYFALKARPGGGYVAVGPSDLKLRAVSGSIGEAERFLAVDAGDDRIAIVSGLNQAYVSVKPDDGGDWCLCACGAEAAETEAFAIELQKE